LKNIFGIFSILTIGLYACSPVIYFPESPLVNFPEEKRELKLEGGITIPKIYGRGTYSLTNNFFVLGSLSGSYIQDTSTWQKNFNITGGLGATIHLSDQTGLQFLAGAGNTKIAGVKNMNAFLFGGSYHYNYQSDYKNLFGQINLDHKDSYMGFGLGVRMNYLYFNKPFYHEIEYSKNRSIISDSTYRIPGKASFLEPYAYYYIDDGDSRFNVCLGISTFAGPGYIENFPLDFLGIGIFASVSYSYKFDFNN
jgi:hypothetical protein